MKLKILNDIHVDGINALMTHDEMIEIIKSSEIPVVCNGDLHDLANCKLDRVEFIKQAIMLTRQYVKGRSWFYNSGNHEMMFNEDIMSWVTPEILTIHGDLAMWPYDKAMAFRTQTPGAGWFKRNVISRLVNSLRRYLTVRPNDRLLAFVAKVKASQPSLRVVIMGHSHPAKRVVFLHEGVTGIIMERGVHDIDV